MIFIANKTASFRWPVIAGTSQGKGPGADPGRSDRNEPKLNVLIPFTGYIHRFLIDFNDWNFYWSLCFGLLSFLIIVGNALSISILFKRRLRKRPHFLLISLAFADLLVGLIPVPLYIIIQYLRYRILTLVYNCVDIFAGLCSIFTLAAISLERLHAIARPLRHRQLILRSYAIAMVTPWILSIIVTSVPVFPFITYIQTSSVIIISLSTPLLITCVSCCIWRKQASRIPSEVRERKDVHLNKTLLLITAVFVLSWLPFQVLPILMSFCISCQILPMILYVAKFLQYSNSFMSFLVYCFRMPDFRKALSWMLSQMQCRCSR